MRTTPWRRTTLQFLQIFLTDARTFIAHPFNLAFNLAIQRQRDYRIR